MKTDTKRIATAGLLCAIAYVFMIASKLIPAVEGFLQFDLKDVIIVTGGFIIGPVYALAISVIVPLIEMITVSHTGVIGMLMNIISTMSFCCTASLIYYKFRTLKGAVSGLVFGTFMLTLTMVLWNYYITPVYMNMPREFIAKMIPSVFIPFNLVKGLINSSFTLILYRPLTKGLSKTGLLKLHSANKRGKDFLPSIVMGLVILALCIPAVIYLLK